MNSSKSEDKSTRMMKWNGLGWGGIGWKQNTGLCKSLKLTTKTVQHEKAMKCY